MLCLCSSLYWTKKFPQQRGWRLNLEFSLCKGCNHKIIPFWYDRCQLMPLQLCFKTLYWPSEERFWSYVSVVFARRVPGPPRGCISFRLVVATFLFSVLNLLDYSLWTDTKTGGIITQPGLMNPSLIQLGFGKHLWGATEMPRVY